MWRCCVARKNDSEHVCWSRFTCQRCRRRRLCQTSCVNRSQTRKESLPSTSLHTCQSTLTAVCLLCCWLAEILVLFGAKMTCITEQNESMNKTYTNYHSASKAQATYCFQQHVFVCFFVYNIAFVCYQHREKTAAAVWSWWIFHHRLTMVLASGLCRWIWPQCTSFLRRIVTFLIIAPYKYSYLLTYLHHCVEKRCKGLWP